MEQIIYGGASLAPSPPQLWTRSRKDWECGYSGTPLKDTPVIKTPYYVSLFTPEVRTPLYTGHFASAKTTRLLSHLGQLPGMECTVCLHIPSAGRDALEENDISDT